MPSPLACSANIRFNVCQNNSIRSCLYLFTPVITDSMNGFNKTIFFFRAITQGLAPFVITSNWVKKKKKVLPNVWKLDLLPRVLFSSGTLRVLSIVVFGGLCFPLTLSKRFSSPSSTVKHSPKISPTFSSVFKELKLVHSAHQDSQNNHLIFHSTD